MDLIGSTAVEWFEQKNYAIKNINTDVAIDRYFVYGGSVNYEKIGSKTSLIELNKLLSSFLLC